MLSEWDLTVFENVEIELCKLKCTNYLGSWLEEVERCEELLFIESICAKEQRHRLGPSVAAKFKYVLGAATTEGRSARHSHAPHLSGIIIRIII